MNKEEKNWYEEVKQVFIKNISDSYTLNLAMSILEDRKSLLNENLDLQHQLEQERNIRKEAKEYMKDFIFEPLMTFEDRKLIIFNENLKKFEEILNKEVK